MRKVLVVIVLVFLCGCATKELVVRDEPLVDVFSNMVDVPVLEMPNKIIFCDKDYEEIMTFEYDTGNIYYKGKIVVTDKELVKALYEVAGIKVK